MRPNVLFFVLALPFVVPSTLADDELFHRVYMALDKVLNFISDNQDSINIDGFFGVAIGKAQLQTALNEHEEVAHEGAFKYVNKKSSDILKSINTSRMDLNKNYKLFTEHLLNSTKWENFAKFSAGKLTAFKSEDFITCDEYQSALINTKFSETKSDFCIAELIKSKIAEHMNYCNISETCNKYMVEFDDEDDGLGYVVLHRLLYLQVTKALRCNWHEDTLMETIHDYCSDIYLETEQNYQCGDSIEMQDVFLEQVLLCGLEGFEEFFQERWILRVVHLQTRYGCYGGATSRRKREANSIAHGCLDHSTGLAAGALSLFFRYLVK